MSTSDDLERTKVRYAMALHPIRQRALLVGLLTALAIGFLLVLVCLVAGMWVDLTFPLPVAVRRLVLPAAGLGAIATIILLMRHSRAARSDQEITRQIDEVSQANGKVMAGYDLLHRSADDATGAGENVNPFSQALSALAARQAEQVCQRVDAVEVVSAAPAKQWWVKAMIAIAAIALVALIVPRMAWTQAQRILIPMESQLPYSPTSLSVQPGDTEVLFGADLEVTATIDGPLVDDLELVLRYDDQSQETLPLLAETDRQWRTYLTRLTQPADYFVRARQTRSESHRLGIRMTPQITSANCIVTPPTYTRRARYEGPIPERGLVGLEGTKVQVAMTSNRPLASGQLRLQYGDANESVTLSVPTEQSENSNQSVQGEFLISRSGHFSMSLVDVDGTPSGESVEGTITVLEDQKPVVRMLEPKPISLATPDIELPIVVVAEDDYGISRIELFRGLNQSPEIGTTMELVSDDASARTTTSLPLSAYGLQPGDEITLFARVEDNDPSGVKGAESPVATVRIISREQLAELELSRRGMEAVLSKQRQAQRLLAGLQEKMKSAEKDLAAVQQATADAAKSLRQAADVELPVDLDRGLNEQLKQMADKLDQLAERMKQLQQQTQPDGKLSEQQRQELDEILQQIDQTKQQHQTSAMNPTERMSKILPLAADQQRYVQLTRRQRSLAERLDALESADAHDPAAKRRADELRREQQQMQVALSQLLEDIQSHVDQLPADPELDPLRQTASEFVSQVRASQADPAMTQTQQGLLDDQPGEASTAAAQAAQILESFLGQCSSMGDQACKNCNASFNPSAGSPKPGNSIEQLLRQMGLGEGQSGMKPGMGPAMAPGGGYAMPQNTMENIGLYGGLPTVESKPRRGNGDKSDGGFSTFEQGGTAKSNQAGTVAPAAASARGDGAAVVPAPYRKQVSDYFRGIAEELGDL
ncbi:hypothetical protein NHH03_16010 [Stieleria sp. TO1_6]|uniref:hypothetical protein n=1 Tax=Stieleria tagensis TaxID=2956795 RepID=UPI00209A720C|nr:hypothetical protein [Stieleria tagensis]MCO8123254.1 hypothetical protein [Stieleria tagensis]